MTKEERKASLRWTGTRICENCFHARELTEAEVARYKNWAYGDKPDLYCEHENKQGKYHPHAVPSWNHCFCHEYDDESVLLPKNPKWCSEGVNDLWPYERERAEKILADRNQITAEELLQENEKDHTALSGRDG